MTKVLVRKVLLLVAGLLLVPGVAMAGGGMQDAGSCPGFADGETVVMRDGCFSGIAQFSDTGALTVVNEGHAQHSYTAVNGSFDTGLIDPGATASLAGIDPGVYKVYCTLHADFAGNGMAGVLVVGDGGGSSAAAPIPPAAEAPPADDTGSPWLAGVAALAGGLALAGVGWWFHRRQVGAAGATNPAT